ncbi:hypothetical protein QL285_011348 [Trifolium repens]|nr:hypothetical protein QL285_011348 [Trifolium repens]
MLSCPWFFEKVRRAKELLKVNIRQVRRCVFIVLKLFLYKFAFFAMVKVPSKSENGLSLLAFEVPILLIKDIFGVQYMLVLDSHTIPTHVVKFNYLIFSNY